MLTSLLRITSLQVSKEERRKKDFRMAVDLILLMKNAIAGFSPRNK